MVPLFTRFTAALIAERPDSTGADLSLIEWKAQGPQVHHTGQVKPQGSAT
jgi:hypothetical protein